MVDKEVDQYYMNMAGNVVDTLHKNRILADDLDLPSIDRLKDYLGALFEGFAKIASDATKFLSNVERRKKVGTDLTEDDDPDIEVWVNNLVVGIIERGAKSRVLVEVDGKSTEVYIGRKQVSNIAHE